MIIVLWIYGILLRKIIHTYKDFTPGTILNNYIAINTTTTATSIIITSIHHLKDNCQIPLQSNSIILKNLIIF